MKSRKIIKSLKKIDNISCESKIDKLTIESRIKRIEDMIDTIGMSKYKLLKELPGVPVGEEFIEKDDEIISPLCSFPKWVAIQYQDWFELIPEYIDDKIGELFIRVTKIERLIDDIKTKINS